MRVTRLIFRLLHRGGVRWQTTIFSSPVWVELRCIARLELRCWVQSFLVLRFTSKMPPNRKQNSYSESGDRESRSFDRRAGRRFSQCAVNTRETAHPPLSSRPTGRSATCNLAVNGASVPGAGVARWSKTPGSASILTSSMNGTETADRCDGVDWRGRPWRTTYRGRCRRRGSTATSWRSWS